MSSVRNCPLWGVLLYIVLSANDAPVGCYQEFGNSRFTTLLKQLQQFFLLFSNVFWDKYCFLQRRIKSEILTVHWRNKVIALFGERLHYLRVKPLKIYGWIKISHVVVIYFSVEMISHTANSIQHIEIKLKDICVR